jgi:nascent polypeptide-associated complex subunit alpha
LYIQKQNEDEPVVEDVKEDEKDDEDEDEDDEDEDDDDDTPGTSFSHLSYWVLVLYFI